MHWKALWWVSLRQQLSTLQAYRPLLTVSPMVRGMGEKGNTKKHMGPGEDNLVSEERRKVKWKNHQVVFFITRYLPQADWCSGSLWANAASHSTTLPGPPDSGQGFRLNDSTLDYAKLGKHILKSSFLEGIFLQSKMRLLLRNAKTPKPSTDLWPMIKVKSIPLKTATIRNLWHIR